MNKGIKFGLNRFRFVTFWVLVFFFATVVLINSTNDGVFFLITIFLFAIFMSFARYLYDASPRVIFQLDSMRLKKIKCLKEVKIKYSGVISYKVSWKRKVTIVYQVDNITKKYKFPLFFFSRDDREKILNELQSKIDKRPR